VVDTVVATAARATDYNITTFAIPGYSTYITGINDSGQFVGDFTTNGDVYYAFLQSLGAATVALQDPATSASRSVMARGINDQGDIVGTYQTLSGGVQSFEYTPTGGYADIGDGSTTAVNAITNTGQYFGSARISVYGASSRYFEAYLNYGNNTSLTFPDGGASAPSLSPQEDEGTFGLGINSYGAMVGDYVTRTGTGQYDTFGYLYDNTGFSVIAPPGASDSIARGVNDAGDIVGNYDVTASDPMTGDTTTSYYDLVYIGGQYQVFYIPGAVQTDLYGINNAGVIVGDVQFPHQDTEGFIATPTTTLTTGPAGFDRGPFPGFPSPPVPEPSSWALMTIGVGGLGVMLRRGRSVRRPLVVSASAKHRVPGHPRPSFSQA
jgi:uncharacterized membrane protein